MHIDQFKQPEGHYKWTDGCDYESAVDLIQIGILGMCGCGCPEDNLSYVMERLEHIDNLRETWDKTKSYAEWKADAARLFADERAENFFYYWADTMDLTEHGGAIPGWLTDKGRMLLEDLRAVCAQAQETFVAPNP